MAKHLLTAISQEDFCPRDEIEDPSGTNVLDRHGLAEGFAWCVIGGVEIFSEPSARVRSVLEAG